MFCNLKRIRESHDLTQREVAKLLNVSKSSYNYFETGEHIIPLKHLNNFCNIFHVSMDFVCGLSNVNTKTNNSNLNIEIISERLKTIRIKNNLSQTALAKILNTSQSNISYYESGKNMILTAFIYAFAKEFNVSLDYLTGRTNNLKIIKKSYV